MNLESGDPEKITEHHSQKDFIGHLDDLRSVLLKSSAAVVIGLIISFWFIPQLFDFLLLPYKNLLAQPTSLAATRVGVVKSLGPSETLIISLKLAFVMAIVFASPIIFYNIWKFISPGLLNKERRYLRVVFCLSPIFFFSGMFFAYYIVFPLGLRFLWNYSLKMGVYPDWAICYYMNFTIGFLCAFGVAFELPVVIILLAKLNLVTPRMLINKRKHAIVAIFIMAAILTPPDVISQILLGIPMILLYELSILMARLVSRGRL